MGTPDTALDNEHVRDLKSQNRVATLLRRCAPLARVRYFQPKDIGALVLAQRRSIQPLLVVAA